MLFSIYYLRFILMIYRPFFQFYNADPLFFFNILYKLWVFFKPNLSEKFEDPSADIFHPWDHPGTPGRPSIENSENVEIIQTFSPSTLKLRKFFWGGELLHRASEIDSTPLGDPPWLLANSGTLSITSQQTSFDRVFFRQIIQNPWPLYAWLNVNYILYFTLISSSSKAQIATDNGQRRWSDDRSDAQFSLKWY